jgi:hypothetical protein
MDTSQKDESEGNYISEKRNLEIEKAKLEQHKLKLEIENLEREPKGIFKDIHNFSPLIISVISLLIFIWIQNSLKQAGFFDAKATKLQNETHDLQARKDTLSLQNLKLANANEQLKYEIDSQRSKLLSSIGFKNSEINDLHQVNSKNLDSSYQIMINELKQVDKIAGSYIFDKIIERLRRDGTVSILGDKIYQQLIESNDTINILLGYSLLYFGSQQPFYFNHFTSIFGEYLTNRTVEMPPLKLYDVLFKKYWSDSDKLTLRTNELAILNRYNFSSYILENYLAYLSYNYEEQLAYNHYELYTTAMKLLYRCDLQARRNNQFDMIEYNYLILARMCPQCYVSTVITNCEIASGSNIYQVDSNDPFNSIGFDNTCLFHIKDRIARELSEGKKTYIDSLFAICDYRTLLISKVPTGSFNNECNEKLNKWRNNATNYIFNERNQVRYKLAKAEF